MMIEEHSQLQSELLNKTTEDVTIHFVCMCVRAYVFVCVFSSHVYKKSHHAFLLQSSGLRGLAAGVQGV